MKKDKENPIVDINNDLEIVESEHQFLSVEQIINQYPGLTRKSRTNSVDIKVLQRALYRVKGQDDNIEVIITLIKNWIRRARKVKPLVLMFAGSSGTGKTYTAKQIQSSLAEKGYQFVRLNMNEYHSEADSWKLLGSSTGYSGSTDDSPLFAARKMSEKLVILFDEIEKAHPSLLTTIMGLMDEGKMANGRGQEFDFAQSIIIFTTNLAMDLLVEAKRRLVEQGITIDKEEFLKETKSILMDAGMRTEICGRIDFLLVYNTFERNDVLSIALTQIREKADEYEIRVNRVSPQYLESIASVCVGSNQGARPINGIIEREIEPFLQDVYDDGENIPNEIYDINYDKDDDKFDLVPSASATVEPVEDVII